MRFHDLAIAVEKLDDGGDYQYIATSPDLSNLTVVGDTPEEILEQVPRVAAALIASMTASCDPLPDTLRIIPSLPFMAHIAVPA